MLAPFRLIILVTAARQFYNTRLDGNSRSLLCEHRRPYSENKCHKFPCATPPVSLRKSLVYKKALRQRRKSSSSEDETYSIKNLVLALQEEVGFALREMERGVGSQRTAKHICNQEDDDLSPNEADPADSGPGLCISEAKQKVLQLVRDLRRVIDEELSKTPNTTVVVQSSPLNPLAALVSEFIHNIDSEENELHKKSSNENNGLHKKSSNENNGSHKKSSDEEKNGEHDEKGSEHGEKSKTDKEIADFVRDNGPNGLNSKLTNIILSYGHTSTETTTRPQHPDFSDIFEGIEQSLSTLFQQCIECSTKVLEEEVAEATSGQQDELKKALSTQRATMLSELNRVRNVIKAKIEEILLLQSEHNNRERRYNSDEDSDNCYKYRK